MIDIEKLKTMPRREAVAEVRRLKLAADAELYVAIIRGETSSDVIVVSPERKGKDVAVQGDDSLKAKRKLTAAEEAYMAKMREKWAKPEKKKTTTRKRAAPKKKPAAPRKRKAAPKKPKPTTRKRTRKEPDAPSRYGDVPWAPKKPAPKKKTRPKTTAGGSGAPGKGPGRGWWGPPRGTHGAYLDTHQGHSPGLKAALTRFQGSNLDEDKEHIAVLNGKGDILFTRKGGRYQASVPGSKAHLIKGAVVTHNHPYAGVSFSRTDLRTAFRSDAAEMRAFGRNPWGGKTSFSMKRTGSKMWGSEAEWHLLRASKARRTAKARKAIRAGTLSRTEAEFITAHRDMLRISKKMGLDYTYDLGMTESEFNKLLERTGLDDKH